RGRHTRFSRDWSSDVCSSDLLEMAGMLDGAQPFKAGADRVDGVGGLGGEEDDMTDQGAAPIAPDLSACSTRPSTPSQLLIAAIRSEERRVGREWSPAVWGDHA